MKREPPRELENFMNELAGAAVEVAVPEGTTVLLIASSSQGFVVRGHNVLMQHVPDLMIAMAEALKGAAPSSETLQ